MVPHHEERAPQRSDAVRNTNDCVASVAVADPVNWSQTSPICGSSEKLMATAACGLAKCSRIKVRSASPSTVEDIDVLALGARIMTRIQTSLPLAAAIRVELVIGLLWSCGPLAATESMDVEGAELRATGAGRMLRGIGALAVTTAGRSTGCVAAGA